MRDHADLGFSRGWLVVAAAAALGVAGTYQFVWSSIRVPLGARLGASEAALGTVFTVYVVCQTAVQIPAGWIRDRYGPRRPLAAGAVLVAAGYAGLAIAPSVPWALAAYGIGGAGAGIAYTVGVNTPVKWFTRRRGLATGVVTMATSGASVLLIPAVRPALKAEFVGTLQALGLLGGVVVLAAALVLRDPPRSQPEAADSPEGVEATKSSEESEAAESPGERPCDGPDVDVDGSDDREDLGWRSAVQSWQFWHLYGVFVVVNGVGLMLIGKVVSFVGALGLSDAVATSSASLIALADAAGIVTVGGVADRLGHERAAATSVTICGVALGLAVAAGQGGNGAAFVALVALFAFFRSPVFAIFPSIVGVYYGTGRSSENYALLYSGKLWGGILGGAVAGALVAAVGWETAFYLGSGAMTLAGLTTFRLRPT